MKSIELSSGSKITIESTIDSDDKGFYMDVEINCRVFGLKLQFNDPSQLDGMSKIFAELSHRLSEFVPQLQKV